MEMTPISLPALLNTPTQSTLSMKCHQINGPSTQAWSALLLIPGTMKQQLAPELALCQEMSLTAWKMRMQDYQKKLLNKNNKWLSSFIINRNNLPSNKMPQKCNTLHQQCIPQKQMTKNILTPEFIALVAKAIQNIQPSNTSDCKHSATWTGTNPMHTI